MPVLLTFKDTLIFVTGSDQRTLCLEWYDPPSERHSFENLQCAEAYKFKTETKCRFTFVFHNTELDDKKKSVVNYFVGGIVRLQDLINGQYLELASDGGADLTVDDDTCSSEDSTSGTQFKLN